MMHEHLHSDMYRWETDPFVTKEAPATPERRSYLLREAIPHLQQFHAFGCHAYDERGRGIVRRFRCQARPAEVPMGIPHKGIAAFWRVLRSR